MADVGLDLAIAKWLLDAMFGSSRTCPHIPATVYFAPLASAPDYDESTGLFTVTEFAGQARVAASNDDATFPPSGSDRTKRLAVRLDGGNITTAWPNAADYFGIFDAATGGRCFFAARTGAPVVGLEGGNLYFEAEALTLPLPVATA